MGTKKEKSKDSIIKTFFKVIGCIFLVLFAMTAIILGICFLSSKLEKYKDNMLMPAIFFVLFYIVLFCDFCMLFSLVENIIKYIKKTKTEINYEDKKVTSGFIKVVIELYGISYMYALLIIFSNYYKLRQSPGLSLWERASPSGQIWRRHIHRYRWRG